MYEKLPQELKDYPYFCGWKYETRNGSRTKVPKSVKGHNADNSNLDDFCGFSEIIGHIGKYDGIGIAITGDMAVIALRMESFLIWQRRLYQRSIPIQR